MLKFFTGSLAALLVSAPLTAADTTTYTCGFVPDTAMAHLTLTLSGMVTYSNEKPVSANEFKTVHGKVTYEITRLDGFHTITFQLGNGKGTESITDPTGATTTRKIRCTKQ